MGLIDKHARAMLREAPKRQRDALAEFFLGVAQASHEPERCQHTLPLFALWLIMDCEGLLAQHAHHLARGPGWGEVATATEIQPGAVGKCRAQGREISGGV